MTWKIFFEKWVPAFITAGLGGLLVAIIVPMVQSQYAGQTAYKNKQLVLWESIGTNFTDFINFHFQLITVAEHIKESKHSKKPISNETINRRENYRLSRDLAASKLNRDLLMAPFYYGESIESLVEEYRKWLSNHRVAGISNMPPRSEFEGWRDKFIIMISKELGQSH